MKSWMQFLHLNSFSDSNSFMTAGLGGYGIVSTELLIDYHHIELNVCWCVWKVGEGFFDRVWSKTLQWIIVYSSVMFERSTCCEIYTCIYRCVYVHTCMYMYIYMCIYMYMDVRMWMYVYTCASYSIFYLIVSVLWIMTFEQRMLIWSYWYICSTSMDLSTTTGPPCVDLYTVTGWDVMFCLQHV